LDAARHDVARFVRSWSADDRYERFGSASESTTEWLLERLAQPAHGALVARSDEAVIGLLDFARSEHLVEIGIVVERTQRRAGVGRQLIRRLLEELEDRDRLVAHCRYVNHPAMRFLASCGFALQETCGGECRWMA
jgi:RimJ/RimL family protein N-acetyltransferase